MDEEQKYDKLGKIPRKDIFAPPDGYFDSLEKRIEARIAKPKAKSVRLFSPWNMVGIAAAAAIGLWLIFSPSPDTSNDPATSAEALLAEITTEDCLAYLESTGLETAEILPMAMEEFMVEDFNAETEADTLLPGFTDEEEELLYQRYGVTSDENLQKI